MTRHMAERPIVFVTPYYPPFGAGGAEYTTSLHARLLADAGRSVVVITPNFGAPERENANGIEILRYPFLKLAKAGHQVPAHTLYGPGHQQLIKRFIIEALANHRPLCLHAQNSFSAVGTWLAARHLKVPFVGHVRDTTMICSLGARCMMLPAIDQPPATCGLLRHAACLVRYGTDYDGMLGKATGMARAAWPYLNFLRRRHAFREAARVAFASNALLQTHARLKDFPDESRLRVVYATVVDEPETDAPAPEAVCELVKRGLPFILYVGKLSRGKGVDVLFQAHKLLLERMPKVRLVVAGNIHGSEWDFNRGRTLPLGFVPREQLPALYRACTVVSVPSTWPEPLGWGTLDAGRYRRPIVATNVGGIPEAVLDGESGILVPPCDPRTMADAFATILSDPARGRAMGERGRTHVLDRFGPAAVTRQLLDLYEGL